MVACANHYFSIITWRSHCFNRGLCNSSIYLCIVLIEIEQANIILDPSMHLLESRFY